jgi:hypothetical protein
MGRLVFEQLSYLLLPLILQAIAVVVVDAVCLESFQNL